MEQLLETVDLTIDESNEMLFKVKVEGTDVVPASVRLVCESDDVSYMFNGVGTSDEGVVRFFLPTMQNKLKEGSYISQVEVLIENRYFVPVRFNMNFKKAVSVVAESISVKPRPTSSEIKVSATPIVVQKPTPVAKPLIVAPAAVQKKQVVSETKQQQSAERSSSVDMISKERIRQIARGLFNDDKKK